MQMSPGPPNYDVVDGALGDPVLLGEVTVGDFVGDVLPADFAHLLGGQQRPAMVDTGLKLSDVGGV